jgi:hypothetical protein
MRRTSSSIRSEPVRVTLARIRPTQLGLWSFAVAPLRVHGERPRRRAAEHGGGVIMALLAAGTLGERRSGHPRVPAVPGATGTWAARFEAALFHRVNSFSPAAWGSTPYGRPCWAGKQKSPRGLNLGALAQLIVGSITPGGMLLPSDQTRKGNTCERQFTPPYDLDTPVNLSWRAGAVCDVWVTVRGNSPDRVNR